MAQDPRRGAVVAPFDLIPDEIIEQLLYDIPPLENLASLHLVSRRFNRVASGPMLWRYHCRNSFRYWDPSHEFQDRLARSVEDTDWKQLFVLRMSRNARTASLLDGIISTKVGRAKRLELIAMLGYDAKDFLLRQCQVNPAVDDGLSRRFFSNAALDSIHRRVAIEEWYSLSQAPDRLSTKFQGTRFERAIGAYDLFVLHDQQGDLNEITYMLDDITTEFRHGQPDFGQLTTRQKALTLARWLRERNLTGMQVRSNNLRYCLIGQVLRHEDHDSIPIISSVIFCCVASRLGIDAQCTGFPAIAYTIVYPSPGHTLDDSPLKEQRDGPPQGMVLDPWGSDDEVPPAVLLADIGYLGIPHPEWLKPAPAEMLVINNTEHFRLQAGYDSNWMLEAHRQRARLLRGDGAQHVEAVEYAGMWASIILTPPNGIEWLDDLHDVVTTFINRWPEDAWLAEKFLMPRYEQHRAAFRDDEYFDCLSVINYFRKQDALKPRVYSRRNLDSAHQPPFKIGQIIRHRRYGWLGVVTSWNDVNNRRHDGPRVYDDDSAIHGSLSETKSSGRFFFACLQSYELQPSVIAARNVELVLDSSVITEDMFPQAGKYFKRFDVKTCTFISNMKEQFPED